MANPSVIEFSSAEEASDFYKVNAGRTASLFNELAERGGDGISDQRKRHFDDFEAWAANAEAKMTSL